MKRYEAISIVSQAVLQSGLAEAIFLKGSIARNEDDDFSDVDMYIAVLPEKENKFLENRIGYMEVYMPLVFWSESNFVGPQIVGVYENGLHFDLYTVRTDSIPQTDDVKIIYDKSGILDSYKKQSLNLIPSDVSDYFNMFTFSLLELEIAYSRGDLIWCTRLTAQLIWYLSMILRYIYDEDNSLLGMKRIYKCLPQIRKEELIDVLNNLTPSLIEMGIKKLISFSTTILDELSADIKTQINVKFYNMMKERLLNVTDGR